HAVTCALCTSSAAARSTITSIANPLHSTENDRRPPGASETDESEERAQGNSPGIRGRLPRQTRPRAHKHHRKRGVRQTTPRSSPIFTRRGWARRRGELARVGLSLRTRGSPCGREGPCPDSCRCLVPARRRRYRRGG